MEVQFGLCRIQVYGKCESNIHNPLANQECLTHQTLSIQFEEFAIVEKSHVVSSHHPFLNFLED
jgi:hypothetical protein